MEYFQYWLTKKPNIDQNKDCPVGWLGLLAANFLFVLNALRLLC